MNRLFWSTMLILTFIILGVTNGCNSKNTEGPNDMQVSQKMQQSSQQKELLVYCGAGLRKPMEEIAAMFQEETGNIVQFSFGGSAQCISQILTVNKGEVFLPGDKAELKELIKKDKIDRQKPVVLHIPVLAIPAGNPAGITGIKDLTKPGIKVALGDPKANPIGKLADQMLKDQGIYEQVAPNIVVRTATVNELFTYLALRQADAAVIWEDNLLGNNKIDIVPAADFDRYIKIVPVVSLKCAANPQAANEFVEFVAGKKAMAVWKKRGFKPAPEAVN